MGRPIKDYDKLKSEYEKMKLDFTMAKFMLADAICFFDENETMTKEDIMSIVNKWKK